MNNEKEIPEIVVKPLFICKMEIEKKNTWDHVVYCINSQYQHQAEMYLYSKQMLFWLLIKKLTNVIFHECVKKVKYQLTCGMDMWH